MVEYYVLSIKRSTADVALWWGPKQAGYYSDLGRAGKYTDAEIAAEPERLNNGRTTLAVPCAEVDALDQLTVPPDVAEAFVKRAAKRAA